MGRVQRDDSAAFAELYDRHSRSAFRVADSVIPDPGQVEEVVQEGFLSIWRGRAGFSPRPGGTVRSWVMETIHDRAVDSALRTLSSRDEGDDLRISLSRLPEAQAEVIALAYFGGLTHTEIAGQLDLPAGTVKGRMRLGLEKLRREMTP